MTKKKPQNEKTQCLPRICTFEIKLQVAAPIILGLERRTKQKGDANAFTPSMISVNFHQAGNQQQVKVPAWSSLLLFKLETETFFPLPVAQRCHFLYKLQQNGHSLALPNFLYLLYLLP